MDNGQKGVIGLSAFSHMFDNGGVLCLSSWRNGEIGCVTGRESDILTSLD